MAWLRTVALVLAVFLVAGLAMKIQGARSSGGAQAFVRILPDGTFDPGQSKNIVATSRPASNAFCVTLTFVPKSALVSAIGENDLATNVQIAGDFVDPDKDFVSHVCPAGSSAFIYLGGGSTDENFQGLYARFRNFTPQG